MKWLFIVFYLGYKTMCLLHSLKILCIHWFHSSQRGDESWKSLWRILSQKFFFFFFKGYNFLWLITTLLVNERMVQKETPRSMLSGMLWVTQSRASAGPSQRLSLPFPGPACLLAQPVPKMGLLTAQAINYLTIRPARRPAVQTLIKWAFQSPLVLCSPLEIYFHLRFKIVNSETIFTVLQRGWLVFNSLT